MSWITYQFHGNFSKTMLISRKIQKTLKSPPKWKCSILPEKKTRNSFSNLHRRLLKNCSFMVKSQFIKLIWNEIYETPCWWPCLVSNYAGFCELQQTSLCTIFLVAHSVKFIQFYYQNYWTKKKKIREIIEVAV